MAEPFRVIDNDETETPPRSDPATSLGIEALCIGLGALTQRTIIALSRLFTLLTVGSAFVLWWSVMPSPTIFQLVGLTIYAVFVLAANFLVRHAR